MHRPRCTVVINVCVFRRVLLDTGEANNEEYLTSLKSVLKEHNVTVDKIIITHWHMDHVGGLRNVLNILDGL